MTLETLAELAELMDLIEEGRANEIPALDSAQVAAIKAIITD